MFDCIQSDGDGEASFCESLCLFSNHIVPETLVCHTKKTALKTIPLIHIDRKLMFKHGMAWSHRVTVLGVVCGVFIYL